MGDSNFPVFKDGDVKVWIGLKVYQLHSGVLEYHSRFFRHALRDAPRLQGFVNLHLIPSNQSVVGTLNVQRSISSPPTIDYLFYVPEKALEYWDNILRILYKIKPNLILLDIPLAMVVSELADLGDFIGAKATADEGIHLALNDLGHRLHLAISRDPITWLYLGSRIRSSMIYREAAIHLVGQWASFTPENRQRISRLPEYTIGLLRDAYKALNDTKKAIEAELRRFDPDKLTLHVISVAAGLSVNGDHVSNMTKATSLFREWFREQQSNGNNHVNADGGAKLYRTIAAGGQAYLAEDKFNYFYGYPVMPMEGLRIEQRLNVLKDYAKRIVAPLLVNESHYNSRVLGQLPYLTSAKVDERDVPWTEWAAEDDTYDWSEPEDTEYESDSQDSWISWEDLDRAQGSAARARRFQQLRQPKASSDPVQPDEA